MSHNWNLPQLGVKIKNIWNHHRVINVQKFCTGSDTTHQKIHFKFQNPWSCGITLPKKKNIHQTVTVKPKASNFSTQNQPQHLFISNLFLSMWLVGSLYWFRCLVWMGTSRCHSPSMPWMILLIAEVLCYVGFIKERHRECCGGWLGLMGWDSSPDCFTQKGLV